MVSTRMDRISGTNTSVAVKAPVKTVTSANITLYGEQTIRGVSCVAGDRVLVANQTSQTENGVYTVSSSDWSRSPDFDGNRDLVKGTIVFVNGGTGAAYAYKVTSSDPIVIGTSNITFEAVAMSSVGDITLSLSGLATDDLIKYSGSQWENFAPSAATIQFAGVSIGAAITSEHDFELTGNGHVYYSQVESGSNAFGVSSLSNGYGNTSGIASYLTSGATSAGEVVSAFLASVDSTSASGGDVVCYNAIAIDGAADVHGLSVGVDVHPIHQHSGTIGDMDFATVAGVDQLASFISAGSDVTMFAADNDTVIIGDAAKFSTISFDLATVASGAGIKPTFEYSTGVGTWAAFSPADGTNGMRQSGVVSWHASDIGSWVVGSGGYYLIRITRTQNTLTTPPVENLVQISNPSVYVWDKSGNIECNSISFDGGLTTFSGNVGRVLLATATASASATVDFTSFINSTYSAYEIVFSNVVTATDNVDLWLRTSTNAGSSFDSGAGNYEYVANRMEAGSATYTATQSSADTKIIIVQGVGNAAGETSHGRIIVFNPSNATVKKGIQFFTTYHDAGGTGQIRKFFGVGSRISTADIDAFRILASSGNITSGTFKLYGIL